MLFSIFSQSIACIVVIVLAGVLLDRKYGSKE